MVTLLQFPKLRQKSLFIFYWVVFSLLCCKRCLYIQDASHLSEIKHINIFCQPVACLFVFLIFSFPLPKVFEADGSPDIYCVHFMDHVFDVICANFFLNTRSCRFPVLFYKTYSFNTYIYICTSF